ncbi:MAG: hypothetical protein JO117_08845 [Verrucomicrobia bacterium]|nr:hypothetical protein [Verrucomicrobiota bacterium]
MARFALANASLLALWHSTRHWLRQHEAFVYWGGGISMVLCIGGLLALPLIAARLPVDYLLRLSQGRASDESPRHWLVTLARNVAGALLLLTGVALLPLPGPGMLVIIVGLGFMDFPAKRRVLLKLVRRRSVLQPMNWVRRRVGQPNLLVPEGG